MLRVAITCSAILMASLCHASNLTVATFNTESDPDTEPAKVAETIAGIGPFDILAVQEVESTQALRTYADAAASALGGKWRYVVSESGINGGDREPDLLGVIYRTDAFRQIQTTEFHAIRSRPDGTKYGAPDWSLRGVLILRLQHLASGAEFQIATVHLKCCNEPGVRTHQAALLAEHILAAGVPTVLLGDTNIPIEPGDEGATDANEAAFNSLTSGASLTWVKPTNPIKTQCSPAYNSMLDQVYGPVSFAGSASAEIKFPETSYCDLDEAGYSDHRPLVAVFPGMLSAASIMSVAAALPPLVDPDEAAEASEFLRQQSARPGDSTGP